MATRLWFEIHPDGQGMRGLYSLLGLAHVLEPLGRLVDTEGVVGRREELLPIQSEALRRRHRK